MSGPSRKMLEAGRLQGSVGLRPAQCALDSGLRSNLAVALFEDNQTLIVNAQAVGGVGGADVTDWTALTDTGIQRIQFGATPVAHVVQGTPTTATLRLRVFGYDQFGVRTVETTPEVSLVAKTNNYVYLSKVFSIIDRVEFQSTALDSGADTISLGTRFEWRPTNDGSNEHIDNDNLGIGTPMRVEHRKLGGGSYKLDGIPRGRNRARMELTFTGNAVAAETVTIDGKVYTWVAAGPTADGEVLVGGDAAASAANLRAAINLEEGAGTTYGAATTLHPTVYAVDHPNPARNGVQAWAKDIGILGGRITVAETMTNASWGSGHTPPGFLRDGRDQVHEIALAWNGTGFPSVGYLTFNDQPLAAETVTIGTTVYTFVAAVGSAFDVLIGATTQDSIDNLVAAINDTGVEGTNYGTGTTPHPSVRAERRGLVLRIYHRMLNSGGGDNTVATTETLENADWGAATMQGACGGNVYFADAGMLMGFSEAGWQGTPDKVRPIELGYIASWYQPGGWTEGNCELVRLRAHSLQHL